MACFGAKSVLLLAVCLCLFTTGKAQLPQLGNLDALLKLMNANTTLSDVLKQLNSTERQTIVDALTSALGKFDLASILEIQFRNALNGIPLGQCGQHLQHIMNNSLLMATYLDAAGKPPSGVLRGNLYWSVSAEQCDTIPSSHTCGSVFTFVIPEVPLSITPSWSGCFPSSCTSENVSAIWSVFAAQVSRLTNSKAHLFHHGSSCFSTKLEYDAGAKWTLALCAVLLLFCLVGTIFDVIMEAYDTPKQETSPCDRTNNVELETVAVPSLREKNTLTHQTKSSSALHLPDETDGFGPPRFLKSTFCELFLCFSLIRNTRKIFSTNVPPTAITSINGIRVFSILWVILGHTFLTVGLSPFVENKASFSEDSKMLSMLPVLNAYFAVDSFFFLSGLLVAYTCFRKMAKSDGKFNWILFYVHRFWRLTPSYMFVILFTVHLKGLISNTVLWQFTYKDKFCADKWWTNLLYINNFYPEEFSEECVGWSWYLANDMQFFVISPILLILAFKYKWRGLLASTGTLLLCSTVVIAVIYGVYDLDPVINLRLPFGDEETGKKSAEHSKYAYSKPYCRIQPYLVGFILGYAIYMKYRGPIMRRAWVLALIGWSVAFAIAMTLVYAPHKSILPENDDWGKTENIFYAIFHRLLWGVVLAWITYACHYGYGSYAQEFLSARFWIPLSRLTYSVYLIHVIVLQFMFNATNGSMHYSLSLTSYYFIASTVLSYGVGFILAVVIEFPSENLEKFVLKYFQERKKYRVT